MSSLYSLKPRLSAILEPLTLYLADRGISADHATGAAMLVAMGSGALVVAWSGENWPLVVVALAVFVRISLNVVDGQLARLRQGESRHGAMLNEAEVVLSDAAMYLPLALVPAFSAIVVVLVVVLALIAEFVGVAAAQVGARRIDGPMGKPDRAAAIGGLTLLLGLGVPPGLWVHVAMLLIAGLTVATVINRFRRSLHRGAP